MAEKLTLASMCAGGVQERIDRALAKISDNILDLNTDAKKSAIRQKTKNCFCGIFIKEAAMETYRVVSITDRKGNPRIEGRYPLRVGRMCKKPTPRNGDAMMIEWLAQPDGTPYVGMIVTSTVIGFKTEDRGKYIEVTTRNSIYTFERV